MAPESQIEFTGKECTSGRSLHDVSVNGERYSLSGSWTRLDDAEQVLKPAPHSMMDPKSYLEGGSDAWLTVAGCSACLFVSFGWVNCIGVF